MDIIHDYSIDIIKKDDGTFEYKYILDYPNKNILKIVEKISIVDFITASTFGLLDHFGIRNSIIENIVHFIAPIFGISVWLAYLLFVAPFYLSVILFCYKTVKHKLSVMTGYSLQYAY